MRGHRFRVLLLYDLRYSLTHLKGFVFLIPFALFWAAVLRQLFHGASVWFTRDEGLVLAGWLLDPERARALFLEHPPTLSVFLLVAVNVAPAFVMLGGCNQLAGDLGSGFVRFLAPRCTRGELFFARFTSAGLLVCGAYLVVGTVATAVALGLDAATSGEIVRYGLRVNAILIVYALPYVAFMSLLSAALASPALALLVGVGAYALAAATLSFVMLRWPEASAAAYLLPSGFKESLGGTDPWRAGLSAAAVLGHAVIYLGAGWVVFRRRDL